MRCVLALSYAFFIVVAPVFAATENVPALDDDTLCAAVYTHAGVTARGYGMASGGFEESAQRAERAHLAANPSENWQSYHQSVTDAAAQLGVAIAAGRLSSEAFIASANGCNARYQINNRAPGPNVQAPQR